MKVLITISGILGGILIILGVLGIYIEYSYSEVILLSGMIIIGLICFPLALIYRYNNRRKIKKIMALSFLRKKEFKEFKEIKEIKEIKVVKPQTKGWGMNDSPFRERKTGLTWGGGNIHGAKASRGARRSFLRK